MNKRKEMTVTVWLLLALCLLFVCSGAVLAQEGEGESLEGETVEGETPVVEGEGETIEGEGEAIPGNRFEGVVEDNASGIPLIGVSVTLFQHQMTEILEAWTTGADGYFRFSVEDTEKQYDLFFVKEGYQPLKLAGLLTPDTLTARMVPINAADVITDLLEDVDILQLMTILSSLGNIIEDIENESEGEGEGEIEGEGEGEVEGEGETEETCAGCRARLGCCEVETNEKFFQRYIGDWLLIGLSTLILYYLVEKHKIY